MSTISIRRPHSLTPKQAAEVADRVAEDLAAEYGIQTEWSGKSASVSGKGLKGELRRAVLRRWRVPLARLTPGSVALRR